MNDAPTLSLVIPCYNEEENLRPLIAAIRDAVDPLKTPYEVVITDDCSRDKSWDILKEMAAADPRLRVQRFASNCGESAASWAGLKAARGRYLVTLDADLQNDPRDLPGIGDLSLGRVPSGPADQAAGNFSGFHGHVFVREQRIDRRRQVVPLRLVALGRVLISIVDPAVVTHESLRIEQKDLAGALGPENIGGRLTAVAQNRKANTEFLGMCGDFIRRVAGLLSH